jgi:hypothetical protein
MKSRLLQLYWSKRAGIQASHVTNTHSSAIREYRQVLPSDRLLFTLPDLDPDSVYLFQVCKLEAVQHRPECHVTNMDYSRAVCSSGLARMRSVTQSCSKFQYKSCYQQTKFNLQMNTIPQLNIMLHVSDSIFSFIRHLTGR